MMQKPTVVLGASPNHDRYSYKAVEFLKNEKHPVFPVGIKNGEILGSKINSGFDDLSNKKIHTVTLYLNEQNQKQWYEKIIGLNPQRVIFNPGTENPEFEDILNKNHIETIEACTLVMLRTGQF